MRDNENEGHSGYRIKEIQDIMGPGLDLLPNVVLLHAGTNDLVRTQLETESWVDAPDRLARLLDDILKACPDTVVIVAQIIRAADIKVTQRMQRFNDAIPILVEQRVNQGFKVTVVDQSVLGLDDLIDGVHP